jgi:type II secretory pathway component GspD/PulD (secretin)
MRGLKMLKKFIFLSLLLGGLLSAAAPEAVYNLGAGTSRLVSLNYQIKNIAVGNPDLVDVLIMSKNEILLNAKNPGITTLTIWDSDSYHDYSIAVYKDSEELTFRVYKLQHLSLIKNNITNMNQMGSVESSPVGETIQNINTVLGCYLDSKMFAVNPWSNSVMAVGTGRQHQKIQDILAALDQKEKMVVFEIEVYELGNDNSYEHSLEIGQKTELLKTEDKRFPLGEGSYGSEGLTYALKSSTSVYTNIYDQQDYLDYLNITLKHLQTEGRAKLLAKPRILTLNNHYSYILSGEKIPVEQKDADGNTNIEYLPTGVILGVVPRVDDSGNINCWIATQVSSLIADSQNSNGNPIIASRETVNEVRLKDQSTLVIGGLLKETEGVIERKIPVLGDLLGWVPFFGGFFKNTSYEKTTSELLITLKPALVQED